MKFRFAPKGKLVFIMLHSRVVFVNRKFISNLPQQCQGPCHSGARAKRDRRNLLFLSHFGGWCTFSWLTLPTDRLPHDSRFSKRGTTDLAHCSFLTAKPRNSCYR